MTGNRSPFICPWNTSTLAEQRDQCLVQILLAQRSATMSKEILRLASCLPITPRWLTRRANLFPFIDPVSHDGIDGLLKGRCCLVGGDREEAGRLFGEDFSRFRDSDVFSLPANAAKPLPRHARAPMGSEGHRISSAAGPLQ